jgi:hypothetical protein
MDQIVGQALSVFRRIDGGRRSRQIAKQTPGLAVAAE